MPPAKTLIAAAASALLVAAVYVLRLDHVAGLVVDDAWYVLLAQSLATGGPFALISSAAAPILPSVPPLFPAALSLVFRISPAFPDNVPLLKTVSIVAMIGAGVLAFRYANRVQRLPSSVSWCIGMAVALTPGFVFLATSTVMAECLFTAMQLLTAVVFEEAISAKDGRPRSAAMVVGAALAAATWMIRSAGIALVAAALVRLIRRRRWSDVAAFVLMFTVCAAPWLMYARAHVPSTADRDRHGGSIVVAYSDAVLLRVAGTASSGRVPIGELPLRAARNVLNIFGRDIGGLTAPILYRRATESGEEVFSLGALGLLAGSMGNASSTIALSLVLSAIALIGYLSIASQGPTIAEFLVPITAVMLLVYPYWTYRFTLPLTPFILVYLAAGTRALAAIAGAADQWRAARILMLSIVSLHAIDHLSYIRVFRDPALAPAIDWLADASASDDALEWMKTNLKESGAVASTNPALVYLRTGRKGIVFNGTTPELAEWRPLGIRYIAALRPTDLPASLSNAKLLYRNPARRIWIIEI